MRNLIYLILSLVGSKNQRRISDFANKARSSYLPYQALDNLWGALGNQKILYVDVGARRGVSSRHWMLKKYFDFVLFEPDSNECDYLKNYYSCVRNEALGDKNCNVQLFLTQDPGGSYTSSNDLASSHYADSFLQNAGVVGSKTNISQRVSVNMRRLDNCDFQDNIGFLKLDVQGEEIPVLNGLGSLRPVCIKVEISSKFNSGCLSQLEAFLKWTRINNYILIGTSFSESQNFSVLPEFNLAFQGDYFLLDGDLVSDKRIRLIAAFMMLVFGSFDFALSLIDDVQLRNTTKRLLLKRPSFSRKLAMNIFNNAHDLRRKKEVSNEK